MYLLANWWVSGSRSSETWWRPHVSCRSLLHSDFRGPQVPGEMPSFSEARGVPLWSAALGKSVPGESEQCH